MTKLLPIRFLIVMFAACMCTLLHAQQPAGKIEGTVQAAGSKPIEAATVQLLRGKDSSVVKFSVSDKTGRFTFDNIKIGTYLIKTEAVGYTPYYSEVVTLTTEKPAVLLEGFTLAAASAGLNNVTVTATRPLIENKIDKTVVNVDASPTNTGLTALEVLERSPGITVDNDGNISLKGKANVVVMVDGKPTYLNATQLAALLKSMSANQLDQIEIMTQPPAKYDAAGNSGIINIKTKKNKANGFNGSVTSSAILAIYFKQTNNINLNWRQGKFNVYGSYGYSHWEGFNDQTIKRSFRADQYTPFNSVVNQTTRGRYTDFNTNYKAGVDFNASKNTTISAGVNGFIDNSFFKSSSVANFYDSLGNFTQVNTAESDNKSYWKNIGATLSLQQKLGSKGAELDADGDYISYRTQSPQYSNNYLYNPEGVLIPEDDPFNPNPYLLSGSLPGMINIYTGKVDFSTPVGKDITLEAGLKTSFVNNNSNAQYTLFDTVTSKWNPDTVNSNHFIYKENINAAYISVQKKIDKFTAKIGVRAEQTVANGYQVKGDSTFNLNYTKLFPTAYISYQPNDNNTWEISYGRRIERPDYQDLNPFQFQLDRYTYQQGNPALQPQFSHNFELGYNYKGEVNVSLNYTIVSGVINDVLITQQDADGNYITYQTKQNIASNKNAGLAVNYGKQLKKWWNINVFGNVFDNFYKGYITGQYIDVSGVTFSGNLSSRFTFSKGWSGEISGFFRTKSLESSAILAQPMGMFALGAGKQILKGKGSLRLNLRDPLYLMHFNGTTTMNTFVVNIHSVWDNRRAILTFTYRFGKTAGQQQNKKSSAAEDEQNRVKAGGGQQ